MKPSDFNAYCLMVKDPSIARGARFRAATNRQQAHRLFEDDLKHAASFAIDLDRRMIGMITLYETLGENSAPDPHRLELGYMMTPAKQGHGYMTAALGMLIERLRNDSQVDRLVALVDERNRPSRTVLVRNRFVSYRSVLDMNSGRADQVYQLQFRSKSN